MKLLAGIANHIQIGFLVGLSLFSVLHNVSGQYENDFIIRLPIPPAGVTIDPLLAVVTIEENLVTPDFRIGQIMYLGSGTPSVTIIGNPQPPPKIEVQKDEDDGKFYLVLLEPLDYELIPKYGVNLVPPARSPIDLQITDLNDNAPFFLPDGGYPTDALPVEENGVPTTPLFKFVAEDVDTVDKGKLVYELEDLDVKDQDDSLFSINSTTGELWLIAALDYETRISHRLQISVTDSLHLIKAPMVTNIAVVDLPDTVPRWITATTRIKIEEGPPTSTPWTFLAVDQDTAINSPIKYSITQDPNYLYFEIGEDSGLLTVITEIDAEKLESLTFELVVTATEELSPFFFIVETVAVEITDRNDNPPYIQPLNLKEDDFSVTIKEHDSEHFELPIEKNDLTGIWIRDIDVSLPYSQYTAEMVVTEQTKFLTDALSLSPSRGSNETKFSILITNRQLIDYENVAWQGNEDGEIEFSVRITPLNDPDVVGNTAVAKLKLKVEDINDMSPEFQNLGDDEAIHFTFDETVGTGYTIGTIQARDADISPEFGTPSLRYRWYKRIPTNMELDSATGVVTVKTDNSFDFETFPDETYLVEAADMLGLGEREELRTVVVVNLHMVDINDETPTIRLPSSQTKILENSMEFDLIMDGIECRDPDTAAVLEISVEVITDSPDPEIDLNTWFQIIQIIDSELPGSGVWRSKLIVGSGQIDRELLSRVDVNVTVKDKTQTILPNSASMFLSIQIEDVNDNAPEFVGEYDDPSFEIRVIETAAFEDGEDTESDYEREIITFAATDKDLDEVLTYKLTSDFPRMLELVELEEITGILRRKKGVMIDREESGVAVPGDMDFLFYTVTVYDNDETHSTSVDIQIRVNDLNDNVPSYEEDYSIIPFSVSEDGESGFVIFDAIQATDADAGAFGTVQYFFDDSFNFGIGMDKFSIHQISGVVTTLGNMDRETVPEYTLQVLAKDNYRQNSPINTLINATTITISLTDVNDNAPTFLGELTLPEKDEGSVTPGDTLGEIQVIDRDEEGTPNSDIHYLLLGVECSNPAVVNPELFFEIEKTEKGFIVIGKATFQFSYGVYNLTVEASDRGDPPLSTNGYIIIKINDVNNFPPIFEDDSDRRYYIHETLTPGTRLRHFEGVNYPEILASDEDDSGTPNGEFQFSFVENEFSPYFRITDPAVGIIYVNQALNLQGRRYELTLKVADLGQPPLSNTINIIVFAVPEINEKPEFEINEFEGNFTENEPAGVVAVLPKAIDPDINEEEDYNIYNQRICYYITERRPDTNYFVINDTTNVLSITQPLDREEYDIHELTIHARNDELGKDCPPPPIVPDPTAEKSNLKVVINVNDVIDAPPVFTVEGLHTGGVKIEANLDDIVYRFQATDPDLDDEIRYHISSTIEISDASLGSISPPQFELRPNTGELAVRFEPAQGMKGHFTFTVNATDLGGFTTLADCKIYLITEGNVVKFTFNDHHTFVTPIRDQLAAALTRVFGYRCNIDRIAVYSGADDTRTLVDSHFIDQETNEPVEGGSVTDKQYDNDVRKKLLDEMGILGLHFDDLALSSRNEQPVETKLDNVLLYSLVAGVGVVTVILVVVSVSCWYNSKSLSRRVRALTASTFGSHDSGLNRVGGAAELPNTNKHAIEGSNPIWTTEADGKVPRDFDTESIGSGGSVLIGVEDDEDFRNYGGGIGNSNPLFGVTGDGDYPMQKGVNPLFGMDDGLDSDVSGGNGKGGLEVPSAPPNIRRNPLMNMDLSGESDQ